MNNSEFNRIVQDRIRLIEKTLLLKQAEYADVNDVFRNFKNAGAHLKTTKEKALWGMAIKHLVSIEDMIEVIAIGRGYELDYEHVQEKIGDMINYLVLLEAMLTDEANSLPF
jgi:hypothetical protein